MILRLFIAIAGLVISLFGYSQNRTGQLRKKMSHTDSLFAVFNLKSPDGYGWINLELKVNKKFYYSSGTDLQQSFSNGTWELKRDTLVLNSDLKRDDIPLLIKEFKSERRDSLYVSWVKNLNDDLVKDAVLFYNDSIKNCMPVFDECKFYKGTISRIKMVFSNNIASRWYRINDTSATDIKPILNLTFSLDKYIFLTNQKFLLTKKGLYELNEIKINVKGKTKTTFVKNRKFFYVRLK